MRRTCRGDVMFGQRHTVTIEPSGLTVEVPNGERLMQAARDAGFWWPNQCNMECRCAGCFVTVVTGTEHLSEMGRAEEEALLNQRGRRALEDPVRLACQLGVYGDVTVRKTGVRSG
ncbi:MAG: 2Fe-2S iron-sulfur cluster binding domain-containing protein [Chloroflexi bacterium]|nr:2Fe-2S iron-sulfur cluster binding domain-containing protein [Chloroflexota bacterium]MYJ57862.1 2Fe-2S iron-sulfur cluster binding domain-containing protein [Chloroflexota bacterium]